MNSIRKHLVQEITKECQQREVNVSVDFVSFLLDLLALNPEYGFKDSNKVDISDLDTSKIVNMATDKLLDQTRPCLVTLKLQLYFVKHYSSRAEIAKKHRICLHEKTAPLITEICNTTHLEIEDVEKLYQKIVVATTLLSGLGNPIIPAVFREAAVALQSVYQPSELTHFMSLPLRQKEEQLMELMCIVAGIRLFNRDCQRGGEGIDDLPSVLQHAVGRTQHSIMQLLEKLMKKVYRFTAAVDKTISINTEDENGKKLLSPDITTDNVEWAVEMLTAARQQEVYIRKLLADVECCEFEIKSLMERLQGRLFKLHDTVRYRTAIPTVQVYPQFIDLADIWMRLQDLVIVLSHINCLSWQLQSLSTEYVDVFDETLVKDMIADSNVLTDAERLEQSMGQMITDCGECSLLFPHHTKEFDKIHLEYLGFCAWAFVEGKGALIPGNPNIGIAKWRGKFFAFSSVKAARNFGMDPTRYVCEALDLVRNNPQYIHLLQLYDDIEAVKNQDELVEKLPQRTIQRDQEVQTELHIVPTHIDRTYTSSLWEYRRRALQLARICQSATHSSQTYVSHFRTGVYIQAAPNRDKGVQTRRDNYANTKKLETFIFGLRGRYDDQQHVLSFKEDEPPILQ